MRIPFKMKIQHLLFMLMAALFVAACNPDCENYESVSAIVSPISSEELLINTFSDFLESREIYADVNGTQLPSRYDASMEGRIVTMNATDITPVFRFYVKDTDCGGFVPLNVTYECDAFELTSVDIIPKFGRPGEEVIVMATPPALLRNKNLFINNSRTNQPINLNARFIEELGGSIVTLPDEMDGGNLNILVENNLCGGFANLQSSAVVADDAFIQSNRSLFITPAPPIITIPQPQITPPPAIINNWFSPQDRDYCIWFVPELDTIIADNGDIIVEESPFLRAGDPALYPLGGIIPGSREISARFAVCRGATPLTTDESRTSGAYSQLLHLNPISGIVDKESGYVNFTIDRTSKGLGIEQFEGTLINVESIPDEYRIAGTPCGTAEDGDKSIMMVVTSKQTDRQLILYRLSNQ